MFLGSPHFCLGRNRGAALLVSLASALSSLSESFAIALLFDLFTESLASDLTIFLSGSRILAAHLDSGGDMLQVDTVRGLVDFLSTATRTEHETLLEIILVDVVPLHPLFERALFGRNHGNLSISEGRKISCRDQRNRVESLTIPYWVGNSMSALHAEVERGYASYTRRSLPFYDGWVLGFCNPRIWECPTPFLLDFYRKHVSNNHLEAGVGSGYFLENGLPEGKPRVALLDINRDCLDYVEKRISDYRPEVFQENLLDTIDLGVPPFDSIALNYVLHCLPGRMETKAALVFDHLIPHLKEDGKIFGSSILGTDVQMSRLAKILLRAKNKKGIFSNANDSLGAVMEALSTRFKTFNVEVYGCVVLFWAKGIRDSHRERLLDQ